ncbi:hypothetical protein [Reyranella sp.]
MKRFGDPRVAATFKAYPPEVRARPPMGELKHCLALALTHHLRAK